MGPYSTNRLCAAVANAGGRGIVSLIGMGVQHSEATPLDPSIVFGWWMIFGGAFCFYISDIFIARDRFLKKDFLTASWGCPSIAAGSFYWHFQRGSCADRPLHNVWARGFCLP